MAKLTYDRHENGYDEPTKITLEIYDDLNIYGFKIVCKRLASAIGYSDESIEDAFGDETNNNKEYVDQSIMREVLKYNIIFSGSTT